jgi:hypothetical protein
MFLRVFNSDLRGPVELEPVHLGLHALQRREVRLDLRGELRAGQLGHGAQDLCTVAPEVRPVHAHHEGQPDSLVRGVQLDELVEEAARALLELLVDGLGVLEHHQRGCGDAGLAQPEEDVRPRLLQH